MAVLLVACASPQLQIETASTISSLDDPFRPYVEYSTGKIRGGSALGPGIGVGINEKRLAARIDRKTAAVSIFLELDVAYTSTARRMYEHATNGRAQPLPITVISHHTSDCSRQTGICGRFEVFHVALPETDLRTVGTVGYPIKLIARNGPDIEIEIPKELIVSLLNKLDADRTAIAAASGNGQANTAVSH